MKPEFQLESFGYETTGVLWWECTRAVTRLSTVKLPGDYGYETCIFYIPQRRNEVLAHYNTVEEAIQGHREFQREYRLTPKRFVV